MQRKQHNIYGSDYDRRYHDIKTLNYYIVEAILAYDFAYAKHRLEMFIENSKNTPQEIRKFLCKRLDIVNHVNEKLERYYGIKTLSYVLLSQLDEFNNFMQYCSEQINKLKATDEDINLRFVRIAFVPLCEKVSNYKNYIQSCLDTVGNIQTQLADFEREFNIWKTIFLSDQNSLEIETITENIRIFRSKLEALKTISSDRHLEVLLEFKNSFNKIILKKVHTIKDISDIKRDNDLLVSSSEFELLQINTYDFSDCRTVFAKNVYHYFKRYQAEGKTFSREGELFDYIKNSHNFTNLLTVIYRYLFKYAFQTPHEEEKKDFVAHLLCQLTLIAPPFTGIERPLTGVSFRDRTGEIHSILEKLSEKLEIKPYFCTNDPDKPSSKTVFVLDYANYKRLFTHLTSLSQLILQNITAQDIKNEKLIADAKSMLDTIICTGNPLQIHQVLVNIREGTANQRIRNVIQEVIDKIFNSSNGPQISAIAKQDKLDELTTYFARRQKCQERLNIIKATFNPLPDEYRTWQTKKWATKTHDELFTQFIDYVAQYEKLKALCNNPETSNEDLELALPLLDKLLTRINTFSENNPTIKLIRRLLMAHARIAKDKSLTAANLLPTYLQMIPESERIPSFTHDLLQNYFASEFSTYIENVTYRTRNLLSAIANSHSCNDIYIALYRYLRLSDRFDNNSDKTVEQQIFKFLQLLIPNITEANVKEVSLNFFISQIKTETVSVNLNDKIVKMSFELENDLFKQWQQYALKLVSILEKKDVKSNWFLDNFILIRDQINNATTLSTLFNSLILVSDQISNAHFINLTSQAINGISAQRTPTQNEICSVITLSELYQKLNEETSARLSALHATFESWNNVLWIRQKGPVGDILADPIENHFQSMGNAVLAKFNRFDKVAKLLAKNTSDVTVSEVNALKNFLSKLKSFTSKDADYLGLTEAYITEKKREDENSQLVQEILSHKHMPAQAFLNNNEVRRLKVIISFCENISHSKKSPIAINQELKGFKNEVEQLSATASKRKEQFLKKMEPIRITIDRIKQLELDSYLNGAFTSAKAKAQQLVQEKNDDQTEINAVHNEFAWIETIHTVLHSDKFDNDFKKTLLELIIAIDKLTQLNGNAPSSLEVRELKRKIISFLKYELCHLEILQQATQQINDLIMHEQLNTLEVIKDELSFATNYGIFAANTTNVMEAPPADLTSAEPQKTMNAATI